MTSGDANIRGDCIINPRAYGGLDGPQTPAKNHFPYSLLHQILPCKVKHWGGNNEEKPLKPFLSDIILVLCSVTGDNHNSENNFPT